MKNIMCMFLVFLSACIGVACSHAVGDKPPVETASSGITQHLYLPPAEPILDSSGISIWWLIIVYFLGITSAVLVGLYLQSRKTVDPNRSYF